MNEQKIFLPQGNKFHITIENLRLEMAIDDVDISNAPLTPLALHDHSYNEIFACQRGTVNINTATGSIHLEAGDIVIIPPSYSHMMVISSVENIPRCTISFSFMHQQNKDCNDLYHLFDKTYHRNTPLILYAQHELCNDLCNITQTSTENRSIYPALKLTLLLSRIAESSLYFKKPNENYDYVEPLASAKDIDRMISLEYIINAQFSKNVNAKTIAEQLYISERQLSRIVKKRYGTTLRQVIANGRIAIAAKMLCDTELSITKICSQIGFNTKSCFYHEFQKKYNMTPQEYRKRNKPQKECTT